MLPQARDLTPNNFVGIAVDPIAPIHVFAFGGLGQ